MREVLSNSWARSFPRAIIVISGGSPFIWPARRVKEKKGITSTSSTTSGKGSMLLWIGESGIKGLGLVPALSRNQVGALGEDAMGCGFGKLVDLEREGDEVRYGFLSSEWRDICLGRGWYIMGTGTVNLGFGGIIEFGQPSNFMIFKIQLSSRSGRLSPWKATVCGRIRTGAN